MKSIRFLANLKIGSILNLLILTSRVEVELWDTELATTVMLIVESTDLAEDELVVSCLVEPNQVPGFQPPPFYRNKYPKIAFPSTQ